MGSWEADEDELEELKDDYDDDDGDDDEEDDEDDDDDDDGGGGVDDDDDDDDCCCLFLDYILDWMMLEEMAAHTSTTSFLLPSPAKIEYSFLCPSFYWMNCSWRASAIPLIISLKTIIKTVSACLNPYAQIT